MLRSLPISATCACLTTSSSRIANRWSHRVSRRSLCSRQSPGRTFSRASTTRTRSRTTIPSGRHSRQPCAMPEPWRQRSREPVFTSPWVSVHRHAYALPKGVSIDDFYVINEPPGVTIVALTAGLDVVLVEQYRAAVDRVTYELPGGYIDDGMSARDQALRELREETGYVADHWRELATLSPSPHRMAKRETVFLATQAQKGPPPALDVTEDARTELVPLADAVGLIAAAPLACAVCVASLCLARDAIAR